MQQINFSRARYEEVCYEMADLLTQEKELKAKLEAKRDELIKLAGGPRVENGIKLLYIEASYSTDYKAIVEDLGISSEVKQGYQKKRSGYWKVTKY